MSSMQTEIVPAGFSKGLLLALALLISLPAGGAGAQDMLKGLDMSSPDMTEAEMTRAELEEALEDAGDALDLTGKRLNGLDLSELDLSGVTLRSARLNGANLRDVDLSGAILDQAWILNADLTDADLTGAHLF